MTIDMGAIFMLIGMYVLGGIFLGVLLPLAIWGTGFFRLLGVRARPKGEKKSIPMSHAQEMPGT